MIILAIGLAASAFFLFMVLAYMVGDWGTHWKRSSLESGVAFAGIFFMIGASIAVPAAILSFFGAAP